MSSQDYSTTLIVPHSADVVFIAITDVAAWWTGVPGVAGRAGRVGDEFSYRYQPHHYSRQRVTELVPATRVVWRVLESELSFTQARNEWDGTELVFELQPVPEGTRLRFTHVGLTAQAECYDACSGAWQGYLSRQLHQLIETVGARVPS